MKRRNGSIQFTNGDKEQFTAASPKKAIAIVKQRYGLRSITRRSINKARIVAIRFDDRIIFPVKHKRTMDKRRNRLARGNRIALVKIERLDVGRRRHNVVRPRIAA